MRVLPSLLAVALAGAGCAPADQASDAGPIDAATVQADAVTPAPRTERYIRSDGDSRLVIELDAVVGEEPRAQVEADLVARLSALLDKPDGIVIVHDEAITSRGADHAWTDDELVALGDETFDEDVPGGTVAMHVMWLDGHHARDTATGVVLGVQWQNTHIALFHDSIEGRCQDQPLLGDRLCTAVQYTVWAHEVGHAIGLVNNGIPMTAAHEDATHPGHDTDDGCLMYWALESSEGISNLASTLLAGGSVADFDAACLADIAAVRDR
jgi:hypothetical protein